MKTRTSTVDMIATIKEKDVYKCPNWGLVVQKKNGDIEIIDNGQGRVGNGKPLPLTNLILGMQWVKVQMPISFDEALKVLKSGNAITSVMDGKVYDTYSSYKNREAVEFIEIVEAKWYEGTLTDEDL